MFSQDQKTLHVCHLFYLNRNLMISERLKLGRLAEEKFVRDIADARESGRGLKRDEGLE